LVGGKDESNHCLNSVDEFNIKDMRVFQADWRMPHNLCSFSTAQGLNKLYIAGGESELETVGKVYQVSF